MSTILHLVLFLLTTAHYKVCADHAYLQIGNIWRIHSEGYPQNAPPNYQGRWTATIPYGSAVVVTCNDLILPWSEPCDYYSFVYADYIDSRFKKVCGGNRSGFQFVTTVALHATLVTGPNDYGARLSCTVKVIPGTDVQPETTTEGRWSYLDTVIEKRDSSEHGGPKGPKGTTCPCGWANKKQARIINGKETLVNEFPFMAGLKFRGTSFTFCGGSIISPFHVLTAAHCLGDREAQISVLLGEHHLYTGTETNATIEIEVKNWIIHPKYGNYENDIAILILQSPIPYSKEVGPICLPTAPVESSLKGEFGKVIGWGRDDRHPGGAPPVLQKADVKFLSKPACHNMWSPWVPKGSKNFLCVYAPEQRACHGDSGGPVAWVDPETNRYTQIGINAFVKQGCAKDWPVVLTDASMYIDWIHQIIAETVPRALTCSKIK